MAVVALASITTVNINGFKSIKQFNPLGSGFATTKSKEGSAVGASIMVLEENNRAHAYIDDGAVVNAANNVAVAADTKSLLITVNISGSKAKDLGITGTFSLNSASNDARAYIEDQAIVTAGSDVTVNANNETVAVSVSGATSAAEKLGIGVSVNVNNVNDIAHAFIGNFEPTLTGEPELTFADNATTANLSFKDATLSGNPTLTFTDNGSDGDTITRASGSWIADGFDLDQSIQVSGSAGNDGTYQIGSISTDGATLTLDFQDTLSDEPNAAGIAVTGQDTLTRNDTGSWIDDGFLAGDAITVTGSGTNNGTYLIDAISDDGLILTLDSVDTLTDEPNAAAVTVATQDTITRNRGSWIIDGFQAGDSIAVTGSTNNDATYSIDSISADGRTLTLGTADTLTDDTDQGVSVVAPTGPAPVAGTVTTTSTVTPLTVSPTLTFTDIALKGGPLPSLTFADNDVNAGAADTIARASGSWVADGFEAGQTISVENSVDNDGTYTIASIDSSTPGSNDDDILTLVAADTLTDESPGILAILNTSPPTVKAQDTITRASGSWIADGYQVGQLITIEGSADNDGSYHIAGISANGLILTLDSADELTDESSVVGATVSPRSVIVAANTSEVIVNVTLAGTTTGAKDSGSSGNSSVTVPPPRRRPHRARTAAVAVSVFQRRYRSIWSTATPGRLLPIRQSARPTALMS